MRFVALASIDIAIDVDVFLLFFGYSDGGQSNRLAAGCGHTDSRPGIVRGHCATKTTIGRRNHRWIVIAKRHCRRLADGTLVYGDMVLDQVHTK